MQVEDIHGTALYDSLDLDQKATSDDIKRVRVSCVHLYFWLLLQPFIAHLLSI